MEKCKLLDACFEQEGVSMVYKTMQGAWRGFITLALKLYTGVTMANSGNSYQDKETRAVIALRAGSNPVRGDWNLLAGS